MTMRINKINNISCNNSYAENKVKKTTKAAAALGSTIGIASALAIIAKSKGYNLPDTIKSTKAAVDTFKKMELNGADVIGIAASSITGGFIGGAVTDKDNIDAKAKEGITQLIGNYIIPSTFVSCCIKLNKTLNTRYKFPLVTKPIQFLFGTIGLITGVISGNKISNKINERLFRESDNRSLSLKDWALQTDNACLVTSMTNKGSNIAKMASDFIPIAHLIPGYLVGTKQNKLLKDNIYV